MNFLVTGSSGFIGHSVALKLLNDGHMVIGIDNLNDYYSVALKEDRLKLLKNSQNSENFKHFKFDISKKNFLKNHELIDSAQGVDAIIHLAAQAGVRHSIEAPQTYIDYNITGFFNIILLAKLIGTSKITYASSSSVYGNNPNQEILKLTHRADKPVSFYAATKRFNELMASVFNNLDGIDFLGLRYFTVYGPYGRPDMALYKFTKNILDGLPIDIFNKGIHERDFTYIDDISMGTIQATNFLITQNQFNKTYNLASSNPATLKQFVEIIENTLEKKAKINYLPMQKGDVLRTYGDISDSKLDFGYEPKISLEEGIKKFIVWYKNYYG